MSNRAADIAGLNLATWDEVMAREYELWTGDHAVIDTARWPLKESVIELHALLLARHARCADGRQRTR